jgi:BlaI family transcriptional regulator, penicillinase repressor
MPRTPQDVTDAELAVLDALWDRGPSTRRQLTDVLYPGKGPSQYTTVQKLLERLEAKGFVTKSQAEGVLTFRPALSREDLISRRLLDVAEKLCGGSLTPLLMNLVRAKPLTRDELRELADLIQELGGQAKRKGDRR